MFINVFSPQPTLWLKAIAIVVSVRLSVRLSVRKQLPCEHTQGYNSSPNEIVNEPTGLRKISYKPLHKRFCPH